MSLQSNISNNVYESNSTGFINNSNTPQITTTQAENSSSNINCNDPSCNYHNSNIFHAHTRIPPNNCQQSNKTIMFHIRRNRTTLIKIHLSLMSLLNSLSIIINSPQTNIIIMPVTNNSDIQNQLQQGTNNSRQL
ncbi:hypothetical protein C1645_812218 [Glomus cerebriforme]|uniref:Uncharacterized protein n=1 Tax=Glomus cerebriforme TaxID=658196 RepID=A0A397TLR8_9GLOM|nr:hypothetical protein C1645_812218 [Glomus cerebriforme]